MKRQTKTTKSALSLALLIGLIVAAGGFLTADAQAAVRVRASFDGAPVRATIVLGDGPRLCSIPKPYERRTVVVRDCGCGHGRHDRAFKHFKHKGKHRNDRYHTVWVDGYWERTGPRTSRWIPGHWARY